MMTEKLFDLELELRELVTKEALDKIEKAVIMAQRGHIPYFDMVKIIDEINKARENTFTKISHMIWG